MNLFWRIDEMGFQNKKELKTVSISEKFYLESIALLCWPKLEAFVKS